VAGGLFFFFRAGGGVRDRNVTGVQTCALPICAHRRPWDAPGARALGRLGWVIELGWQRGAGVRWAELDDVETGARVSYFGGVDRSEERRVGRGRRFRRAPLQ